MSPAEAVATVWRRIVDTLLHYLRRLDAESVKQFQAMYYLIFMALGVSILAPGTPEQDSMKPMVSLIADMWIGLHLVCPLMTLAGRRLTSIASRIGANKPNPAWPGALLQLWGDAGVWACVILWFFAVLETPWWTRWLIIPAVLIMCVLGGAMFTIRSLRRVYEIKRNQILDARLRRWIRRSEHRATTA